jgi:amino acid adenylation domain-containing protein
MNENGKLSSRKRALIELLLDESDGHAEDAIAIAASRGEERREVLSFAQERLWFIERMQPGTGLYNLGTGLRVGMAVDREVLERAVNEVVRRHEVLRTRYVTEGERTVQVVSPSLRLAVPLLDVSGSGQPEVELSRVAMQEAQAPFDLVQGPVARFTLVRLGSDDHVILATLHHIATDGWSMEVLVRELVALYQAFAAGRPSPLPELTLQYADYARWQRGWLTGSVLEEQLSYWRGQLATAPTVMALPTDRPRPAVQSYRGATHEVVLPRGTLSAVEALAQRQGATVFMALAAAFQTLLYRYTGEPHVVCGTPIANRTRSELEPLIGFFVNTLVLHTDLGGNPRFREVVERVKKVTLDAYAHQDLPFEKLVEELRPERTLSHHPLFQVSFTYHAGSGAGEAEAGRSPGLAPLSGTTSKFDLSLVVYQRQGELVGTFEYNTDLLDAATVARMGGHLATLLGSAVADPEQGIDELELLLESEREQLVRGWNATGRAYAEEATLHGLLSAQAARTPEATALELPGEATSYRSLEEQSNQVAQALRGLGVRPGDLVGLSVERHPRMVVGLLGILKAGAAYVPLDPAYPSERLSYMIQDARLSVMVSDEAGSQVATALPLRRLRLDGDSWRSLPATAPPACVHPEDLAYVIYTSGSTGRPKGVMVPHRGLSNLVSAQAREFGLGPGTRVLQFASISFDISVWELLLALGTGGTLCFASPGELLPGPALHRTLRERRISFATLLPSVLGVLPEGDLPDLTTLVAGAEACPAEVAQRFGRDRRFYNGYGPTETSVWATGYRCRGEPGRPPIGRPIDNVRTYVVDRRGGLLPVGVPGELLIAGVSVARGYLGRPDLTAERFVPDPFAPGHRAYRSGDLVRQRADGDIEFLGRVDGQVKLRGYRIELGEIEAVLSQHAEVRECAVLLVEEPARLVGYYIPRGAVDAEQLRAHLREQLPEYMVPASFVPVARWPLSATGKLDRRQLAQEHGDGSAPARVAPRTPMEASLATIFAHLLGLDAVSVLDNFFELGGHSLLATQLVSRIRDTMNVEVSLRAVFEHPTVAGLAVAVVQAHADTIDEVEMSSLLDDLDQLSSDDVNALLENNGE